MRSWADIETNVKDIMDVTSSNHDPQRINHLIEGVYFYIELKKKTPRIGNFATDIIYQSAFENFYHLFKEKGKDLFTKIKIWKEIDGIDEQQIKKDPLDAYENLLDSVKKNCKSFQKVFCSKVVHTINENVPIFDSVVRDALDIKYPDTLQGAKDTQRDIKKAYDELQNPIDLSNTKIFLYLLKLFDDIVNNKSISAQISDVKKIDFLLYDAYRPIPPKK